MLSFAHFWVFLGAVWDHAFTLAAGCVLTVVINLIEKHALNGKKLPLKVDVAILLIFVFFACFQAWRDEYNRANLLDHPLPLPTITVNVPPPPPVQVVVQPAPVQTQTSMRPKSVPAPSPLANVRINYQHRVASANAEMPFGIEVLITTDKEITPFALNLVFTGEVGKFTATGPIGIYTEQQGGIRVASPNVIFLQRRSPGFTPDAPLTITAYSKTYIELKNIESVPFNFPLPASALKD